MEATFLEDEYNIKKNGMQTLRRICYSDIFTFNNVYCFQFALHISLVAQAMLSIYAKLSSHILAIGVRAPVNMQGTVFTLARLKIIPTIKNWICSRLYDCAMRCSRELYVH